MPFKINISNKGKTYKLETESEILVGKSIGDKFKGEDISPELKGFQLEITGTSDLSGIPGFKGLEGAGYHRRLLTLGPGMKDRRKGIRLRKTNRGEEISLKTHQINSKLIKEGDKKFESLFAEDTQTESPDSANSESSDQKSEPGNTAETESKPTEETKAEPESQEKKE